MISLFAGRVLFPPLDVFNALFGDRPAGDSVDLIVWHLRLPRTLLAIIVGGGLGMAGAALQGLLRNPLAEPGVVGVSTSAAFGSVAAFYSGLTVAFPLALPLGGMAGALIGVGVLMLLAGRQPGMLTLILAGVAVNSLGGALTALALNLSPNPYAAAEIVFWLMGSLADRSMETVWLAAAVALPGWLLLLSVRSALDALTLGEEAALSLGIDLRAVRWRTVAGVALAVGAGVSVCGTISFVGLVVPHLLRPFVGYQPGRLVPLSTLGGAILLLVTDIAVRLPADRRRTQDRGPHRPDRSSVLPVAAGPHAEGFAMSRLRIDSLEVRYDGRPVLKGIDATLEAEEIIGLIGPNGAGKTTLLRTCAHLLSPQSGEILLDDRRLDQIPRKELARTIAYIPSGAPCHWPLEVERLVALGRLPHLSPWTPASAADGMAIAAAMELTDVTQFRGRPDHRAFGRRTRTCHARPSACRPTTGASCRRAGIRFGPPTISSR